MSTSKLSTNRKQGHSLETLQFNIIININNIIDRVCVINIDGLL